MDKAIIVDHLCKDNLFKDVSFTLQSGEFVGLLGPKGSGKTELIKILLGLNTSDSGFISILGFDPAERQNDYLKRVSVVFSQKNELINEISSIQYFDLSKSIYSISEREYKRDLDDLVNSLRVSKLLEKKVVELTAEQKIKMELIASLIHKPKVLFLDEPFLRFDIRTQHILFDFVYEYVKRNQMTVLLSSESVNDLVGLVRRVIVIDEQRLLFDGPLEKITEKDIEDE